MGLITHNRIYVCISASPCPVIVDLVIIGSIGSSHHHASLSPATVSWPQPAVPVGAAPAGYCPCRRPPLAGWPWVAGPAWGLAMAGRSYIPVFQIRMEKMKEVKRPPL
ncbi:hypothetical protein BHE74_00053445 [Ensete ventricosum]|nr:hypothetical protein GW17_00047532 [Ensete ventricosum]RWW41081.1 hypothetical protein BHE74_00053445 [Ensete ventricosum]